MPIYRNELSQSKSQPAVQSVSHQGGHNLFNIYREAMLLKSLHFPSYGIHIYPFSPLAHFWSTRTWKFNQYYINDELIGVYGS